MCLVAVLVNPVGAQSVCPFPGVDDEEKCQNQRELDIVIDYGADGTDNEDDRDEIEDALGAAAACADLCGGATVVVPAGTFDVSYDGTSGESLEITSGVTLRGKGMGISILKLMGDDVPDGAQILKNHSPGDSHIHLSDLTFDGNWEVDWEEEPDSWQFAVEFTGVTDFTFTRCEFQNFSNNGVVIQDYSERGVFDSCLAHHNHTIGFYIHRHAAAYGGGLNNALVFKRCYAWENGFHGFAAYASTQIRYVDCMAWENGVYDVFNGSGFDIDGSGEVSFSGCISRGNLWGFATWNGAGGQGVVGSKPTNMTFSACIAEGNESHGFKLASSEGTTMTSCHSRANGYSGIFMNTGCAETGPEPEPEAQIMKHFSIVGGSVIGNGLDGGGPQQQAGIALMGVQYGTVSGVTIMNNATHGVYIDHNDFFSPCEGEVDELPSERIVISGCTISDDQATKTQDYAIHTEDDSPVSTEIHAFFNNVEGNTESCPIVVTGEHSDNPGNPDTCN